jgi:hypothetical protein
MSGYELWLERLRRVHTILSANDKLSAKQREFLQLWLLLSGQFNASFKLEEIERLGYDKSPFACMYDHAYLRATNTWAMQILTAHYQLNKPNGLHTIWVDSRHFWKELERYNNVVLIQHNSKLTELAAYNIEQQLKNNNWQLPHTYWVRIQDLGPDDNLTEVIEYNKQTILKQLLKNAPPDLRKEKSNLEKKLIFFFRDHFQNMEAITLVEKDTDRRTDKLINSLGYRVDPITAIRNVLKLYPNLFVDVKCTEEFWKKFKETEQIKNLTKAKSSEQEKKEYKELENLIQPIRTIITQKNPVLQSSCNIKSLSSGLSSLEALPREFELYKTYLMKYTTRYVSMYEKNHFLHIVAGIEVQYAVKLFITACTQQDLNAAIRAVHIITEVMQLDLMMNPYSVDFADTIGVQYDLYKYSFQGAAMTTYAMRSFVRVLQALNPSPTSKIAITNQAYYELLENFERINSKSNAITLIRQIHDVDQNADIIFIEMHPNNVVEAKQYAHDSLVLLEKIHSWQLKKPRTLVVDVTLNALNDEEVLEVLNKAQTLINSSNLNLILIQTKRLPTRSW